MQLMSFQDSAALIIAAMEMKTMSSSYRSLFLSMRESFIDERYFLKSDFSKFTSITLSDKYSQQG